MFNTINPISLPTSSGKCDNNMAFQLKDSTGHTNVQNLFLHPKPIIKLIGQVVFSCPILKILENVIN